MVARRFSKLLLALLCTEAMAQGIVLDQPAPERTRPEAAQLKAHSVKITIDERAAQVEVTQVFHNPNRFAVEGVYLFPLPESASVSQFTMQMGDKQVKGEILDAKRARAIYRSIVHARRDPGLLEYAGRRLLRARLFPLPPRGDTKVTLRYEQVLDAVGGVYELSYPLKSDRFASGPVKVSGFIEVKSEAGVATLFSPSHKLDVVRKSDAHAVASFEESRSRGDRDLRVLYSPGRKGIGLALTTHKPAGEDGAFLMLLSPKAEPKAEEILPKDIVFVLDTSGSMGERGGAKLRQAKAALTYALGRLATGDRFNIVAFATEARPFRETAVAASKENVAAALAFVEKLEATGGTAIHEALQRAVNLERADGRVPLVLFLTDGQPTVGPRAPKDILKTVAQANTGKARLFVFGVGEDVNTLLLSGLANENGGADHYVAESEDIELKVSALYDQVASPVLTGVTLKIDGIEVYDVYPRGVRDLFKGQQLVVVGRYAKPGAGAITLSGRIGSRDVSFVYEKTFGTDAGRDYVQRIWAVRKVGFLLDEIRHNGENPELVGEIKKLGVRFGIVTPYTSFLVVEEGELEGRPRPRTPGPATRKGRGGRGGGGRAPAEEAPAGGEAADTDGGYGSVKGAKRIRNMKDAEGDKYTGVNVKTIEGKTFRLVDGTWTDTTLEDFKKKNADAETVTVKYLSEDYDKLLDNKTIVRWLSLGSKVTFVNDGKVYVIVE